MTDQADQPQRQLELIPQCVTTSCQEAPTYRFTWPGRAETPACEACAARAQNVAKHMGFDLQVLPLLPFPGAR